MSNPNFLLKNTLIFTIGEVIPKLLSFILLPIYMQYFTPSDYGIIGYTSAVFSILPIITSLGLSSYVLRFYFDENNELSRKELVGNVFCVISVVNIIIFVLGYFYLPVFLSSLKISVPWDPYFKYSFFAFFLDIFTIIPLILFRIKQNAIAFVLFSTCKVLLQYLLILFFVINLNLGLVGFYLGNLFALIPFVFISIYLMFKTTIFNLNVERIKKGLYYSLPLIPGSLAYLLLNSGDRFFLEYYVTLSDLGIYNISSTIALSLNLLISSVYKAVEPEIFIKYSEDSFSLFINNFKKMFLFFLYTLAIIVAFFTKEVMQLISKDFSSVYLYVPIILISVLMSGSNIVYSGILSAEKNTRSISKAVVIGTIVSLSFNFYLIPIVGVFGSAVSSSIAFISMNYFLFLSIKNKHVGYKIDLYLVLLYILFILPIVFSDFYFFLNFSLFFKFITISLFVYILSCVLEINLNFLIAGLKRNFSKIFL